MRIKPWIIIIFILFPACLFSYEPGFQLTTGISGSLGRLDEASWDSSASWDGGALFFWRTRLGDKSFFTLAYQLSGSLELETGEIDDSHYLLMTGKIPLKGGFLTLSQETQASLVADDSFNTRDFFPSWEIRYDFGGSPRAPSPFLVVSGRVNIPQDIQNRFIENTGLAGLKWAPSFRRSYEIQAGYGFSRWIDNETSRSDGSASGIPRTDHLLSAKATGSGLIGFYGDYEATVGGTLRLSNENRIVDAELEEDSEDRFTLDVSGRLGWAPIRRFSTSLTLGLQEDFYLSRQALTDQGALSGERLSLFLTQVELESQWRLGDRWDFFGNITGSKSFSNETVYAGENLSLSLWLELSLGG